MLKAIKELGQYIRENKNLDDVQILTNSESYKLINVKKMVCVVFKKKNGGLSFDGVHIEDFDREKASKLLYKTFKGGHYDFSLTSKIKFSNDSNEVVNNIKKRWDGWFKHFSMKYNVEYLRRLEKAIRRHFDKIFTQIREKYESLKKDEKRNALITIKLKENNKELFLADVFPLRDIFVKEAGEYFYRKRFEKDVYSKGEGVCSLCFRNKEVYGFASPFSVFAVKKIGFTYGFSRENAWKQLPICHDCALDLQVGKKFLQSRLSFKLYGYYYYYVIPFTISKHTLSKIIKEIESRKKSEDYRDGLLNAEEDILDLMKEKRDIFNLIFVFYQTKGKEEYFDIIRYVEEVPPSWIKKIYDTFRSTTLKSLFKEEQLKTILGEKWSGDFREGRGMWNGKPVSKLNLAGMIEDFFYHEEEDRKVFDKSTLNILGDILEAKHIDKGYFIKHLIEAIRKEHVRKKERDKERERNEKLLSLKSLYLLNFLLELELLSSDCFKFNKKFMEVQVMGETNTSSKKVEEFFNEFSKAFDKPEKKAAFLEGVLTSFLLDIQYVKKGNKPFRSKLHGLKLNKRLIKKLFPEIIEKLRQYDAGYPWLELLISKYIIEAEQNNWNISEDEISLYFTLGKNLGKIFKDKDNKNEDKKDIKGGEQNE